MHILINCTVKLLNRRKLLRKSKRVIKILRAIMRYGQIFVFRNLFRLFRMFSRGFRILIFRKIYSTGPSEKIHFTH